jgi:hypothetical protein
MFGQEQSSLFPSHLKSKTRVLVQKAFRWVPILLAPLLLWWVYKGIEWQKVNQILEQGVNYKILFFSLLFGTIGNVVRGLRWLQLMGPARSPQKTDKISVILATLGTYAVNMLLPRAGEVWRCSVIAKGQKRSFAFLLGTVVAERLADILVILIMTIALVLFKAPEIVGLWNTSSHSCQKQLPPLFTTPQGYTLAALFLLFLCGGIWFLLKRPSLKSKVKEFIRRAINGLQNIRHLSNKKQFVFYSVAIWGCYFFFFYIPFFAFSFTEMLPLEASIVAFSLSTIAIVIPVQGGIGPWHFAVISALYLYGVDKTSGGSFALIVHSIQSIWTVIIGLIAIFVLTIVNKKVAT